MCRVVWCVQDKIIGGICFRPFFEQVIHTYTHTACVCVSVCTFLPGLGVMCVQRFAEIAFLAITSTEQVKVSTVLSHTT